MFLLNKYKYKKVYNNEMLMDTLIKYYTRII